jgi:ubiquinone biosynthesis protein UbiJ
MKPFLSAHDIDRNVEELASTLFRYWKDHIAAITNLDTLHKRYRKAFMARDTVLADELAKKRRALAYQIERNWRSAVKSHAPTGFKTVQRKDDTYEVRVPRPGSVYVSIIRFSRDAQGKPTKTIISDKPEERAQAAKWRIDKYQAELDEVNRVLDTLIYEVDRLEKLPIEPRRSHAIAAGKKEITRQEAKAETLAFRIEKLREDLQP